MQLIDDLVTENAELQQQLTRAEETIRREQQQMRQVVHVHVSWIIKSCSKAVPRIFMGGGVLFAKIWTPMRDLSECL